MKTILTITKGIDRFNERIGSKISWITFFLMLLVCLDVLRRLLFNQTEAWILELEWHFFALLFLFGAGYTFLHNRHVRVDVFYARQSKKDRAWVNLAGIILLLLPWTLILIYWSFHYAWQSYLLGEGSPNPNGLPNWYLIKFAIPVGLIFLLLQALSELGKSILTISDFPKSSEA